jgi:dihydrodipicolinate synthase/N-acetylneuraminate lyase
MDDAAQVCYKQTVPGTVCLPWRDDNTFDEACFGRTITQLVEAGLPDLYVFHTAGEGYAVTESDFRRVASIFAKTLADAGGAELS